MIEEYTVLKMSQIKPHGVISNIILRKKFTQKDIDSMVFSYNIFLRQNQRVEVGRVVSFRGRGYVFEREHERGFRDTNSLLLLDLSIYMVIDT